MAKITRQPLIPFGGLGPTADFGQFGSQAALSPVETKDIPTIQALDAWKNGFQDAVALGEAPYLQDMNSALYVLATELAYVLQEGVPEYDSTTSYYIGSIVKKTGTFELYGSLIDSNVGNALPSRVTNTDWAYLGLQTSLAQIPQYQRPNLLYVDGTHVEAIGQNYAGQAGVWVLFPDGELRKTTTSTYYRLDIGRVAALSGGSKQSGLISGSVASNTAYSLFAVKSQDTADWIMVAVSLDYIPANFATFNSDFGTNAWKYLGVIFYGNNGNAATGILKFVQSGSSFVFDNSLVIQSQASCGKALASTGAASSLSWVYAGGMGAAQVPQQITITQIGYICVWGASGSFAGGSGSSGNLFRMAFSSNVVSAMNLPPIAVDIVSGINATAPSGSTVAFVLTGFIDDGLKN